MSFSSYFLPATWDEGEMSFRAVESPVWIGTVNAEGHPQLPVILASFGRFIFPHPLSLGSLRFGNILFFAIACGAFFRRMKQIFGTTAAVFFIPSVLLIPRLFAHCQIAAWDSALISSCMLAWVFCPRDYLVKVPMVQIYVLFGICIGLTLSSKFTGWAVFVPFGLYFAASFAGWKIYHSILISLPASIAVFYLLNPPLWSQPVSGFLEFFQLNTSRGNGQYNVAIQFFGTMYDLNYPLPWYNTLAWIGITVPAGILFLSAVGIIVSFVKYRQEGLLLLLNFVTLPVIRSFSGTPVHDGVRLFVSCFPFLAAFAAIGASFFWDRKELFRGMLLQRFAVISVFTVCTLNMFAYAPQYLSFYNVFIGGLTGAVNSGMEATYYWDSFDSGVIKWLNEHTEPDEKVAFSAANKKSILLNRNSCRDKNKKYFTFEPVVIPPETTLEELKSGKYKHPDMSPDKIRYYVLQRRPSGEYERDKQIIQQEKFVFRKQKNSEFFVVPVPLLEIYQLNR